jgi:hypothetical protein
MGHDIMVHNAKEGRVKIVKKARTRRVHIIQKNGLVIENHYHEILVPDIMGHDILIPDNMDHLNILGNKAKKGCMKVKQARTIRVHIIQKNGLVIENHYHEILVPDIMGHLNIMAGNTLIGVTSMVQHKILVPDSMGHNILVIDTLRGLQILTLHNLGQ